MLKLLNGIWNQAGLPSQGVRPSSTRARKQKAGAAVLAIATAFFVLAPMGHAQSDGPGTEAPPPPPVQSHAGNQGAMAAAGPVVRLSDVEGMVQILRGNQTEFSQAVMNMPLIQGSRIETGADGRAEIEFQDGSVARITPNSSLSITRLQATSDGTLETAVEQLSGLIYYELRSDSKTPFQVMIGDRRVTPLANSTFRINLDGAPQGLAVMDGRVQVEGASNSYLAEVRQGQTINFQPSGNAQYTIAEGVRPNGFDEWNDQRDQEAAQEAQNQTPARVQQGGGSIMDSGIGWSDLDNAGGWYPLPGYGMVWQPWGAGPGFDPYGFGEWADFGGGYSWISGYSWGWLPFNCGAWSYIGSFGWGWMPGAYGCGGFGIGFGGYGYGRYGWRWRNRLYPHTNIHGAPNGYRAPVAPSIVKGQTAQRMVRVGTPAAGMTGGAGRLHAAAQTNGRHGNSGPRAIAFNGTKVAPLHSMMTGVRVPVRNAALYNNYPAHAFQGGVRNAVLNHTGAASGIHSQPGGLTTAMRGNGAGNVASAMRAQEEVNRATPFRGSEGANHGAGFNVARGQSMGAHPFGGMNRASVGQHNFGPRGGYGGSRGGGGFRSGGGMVRAGGFSAGGGGFHSGGGAVGGGAAMGHAGGGGEHQWGWRRSHRPLIYSRSLRT